jgi:hypothetical protein
LGRTPFNGDRAIGLEEVLSTVSATEVCSLEIMPLLFELIDLELNSEACSDEGVRPTGGCDSHQHDFVELSSPCGPRTGWIVSNNVAGEISKAGRGAFRKPRYEIKRRQLRAKTCPLLREACGHPNSTIGLSHAGIFRQITR